MDLPCVEDSRLAVGVNGSITCNPMKTFYICAKSDFDIHKQKLQGHYIVLADGRLLLCCEFHDIAFENKWITRSSVTELPHANSGETLTQDHVNALQKDAPGVSTTDNAWTLAKKVSKIHPLTHLR
jgi:hypothetical protein